MNERWSWIIRYGIVIVLALALAYALGGMELFRTTRFGRSGLNAARLVEFFGYGGALLVFWLTARRAAALIGRDQAPWHHVRHIIVPAATLIVLATAHAVVLLVLGPFMGGAVRAAYNWVFIVAIILSCAWMLAALLTGSSSLPQLFGGLRPQRR
jgi:hypothetical protein